jgi:putative tricarboxylic transport membrane protein
MPSDPSDRAGQGGGASGASAFRVHPIDVVVSGVVIVLCALLYWRTFYFDAVPSSLAQNVQPATFPRLVLICTMAFALILPFEHHRKLSRGIDLDAERSEALPGITWATMVALLLFVAALPTLGALPALVLITLLLPLLWGERRWKIIIPYVLLFPIGILFLFAEVLEVTFPRGLTGGIFY